MITGTIDRMQKETINRYLKLRFTEENRAGEGVLISARIMTLV